jgi:hypothetical protein
LQISASQGRALTQAAKRSKTTASTSLVVAGATSFLASTPGTHGLATMRASMTFSSSIGSTARMSME